jgi:hypothetical protein
MKDLIGALPQPLKSLYILAILGLLLSIVAVVVRAVEVARWGTGAVGMVLFLIGLCAVTNFRDSASGLVNGVRNYHPFGADFSKSPLASMVFARSLGAIGLIVGAGFMYASFFGPDFRVR